MLSWENLLNEFKILPRDVSTVPLSKTRNPLWFYVFVENNKLYVKNSINKLPSSKIDNKRLLSKGEYLDMLDIYKRRCKGEAVSREATQRTKSQVYWYGIFNELNL